MFPLLLFLLLLIPGAEGACTVPTGGVEAEGGLGQLCQECSFRGRVVGGACVCSDSNFDPALACLTPGEVAEEDVYEVTLAEATCTCHASFADGFFRLSTPAETRQVGPDATQFVYGLPEPPVCDECLNDVWGPKPGTVTASQVWKGNMACNVYGGPDPDEVFT